MSEIPKNRKPISVAELAFAPREGGYVKGHETREQILHAALRLLVEEGYRAMSMRRVAAECGMKLGNLTYHFASREDLVRDLLDAVIRSYEVEFDEITSDSELEPAARLAIYCELVLEDIRTKKTTRVFPELWALSNHDPFVLERVQDLYRRARAPLAAIIADMRPDLADDDRQALALFISVSMEGTTPFIGYEKPFEPIAPTLERIAVQSFVSLVMNYASEVDRSHV